MGAEIRIVNPDGLAKPPGLFGRVARVKASEYLFISGQVASDEDGKTVGVGDCRAQTRQSFANMRTALQSAGADFRNVIAFTTYLVRREDIDGFMEVRKELFAAYYPEGNYPLNTFLIVSGLVRENLLVEVEAIAAL